MTLNRTTKSHLPNSLEHILTELARLDLLIRREVLAVRLRQSQQTDDEFRGLYISEQEVESLLQNSVSAAALVLQPLPPSEGIAALENGSAALNDRLDELEDIARGREEELRLERLVELFDLSPFDRQ